MKPLLFWLAVTTLLMVIPFSTWAQVDEETQGYAAQSSASSAGAEQPGQGDQASQSEKPRQGEEFRQTGQILPDEQARQDQQETGESPTQAGRLPEGQSEESPSGPPPENLLEASKRTAFNSIFLEALGPGALYSVNYDRMIGDDFSLRIGTSFLTESTSIGEDSDTAVLIFVPLLFNYLGVGGLSHKLELGAGPIVAILTRSVEAYGYDVGDAGVYLAGTILAGYRYSQYDGGFLFRVGFSPMIMASGFLPWPYLSAGVSF